MDYPNGLNEFLEMKTFSAESLAELFGMNGITNFRQDRFFQPHLRMAPNLEYNEVAGGEDSHGTPAYCTPASERGNLTEAERPLFDEVLAIQKMASQDDHVMLAQRSNIIFRKLATGVMALEELQKKHPELSKSDFDETRWLIETLIRDGRKKLGDVRIEWQWKEGLLGGCGAGAYLHQLQGGNKLLERAKAEAQDPGIFDRIKACIDGRDPQYAEFIEERNKQTAVRGGVQEPEQQKASVRGQMGNRGAGASDNFGSLRKPSDHLKQPAK